MNKKNLFLDKFLKSEGNATTYEIVAEAVGRSMTSITRMTGFPNERIEAETIEGDGKGTKLTFNLKVVPTGTEITLEGDVILPGFAKLLGSAIKGRIESGMQDELKIVKDVLEKT